jgi:hypothetical protein
MWQLKNNNIPSMKKLILLFSIILIHSLTFGQNTKRWSLLGKNGICWKVKDKTAHLDHIEMSGLRVSAIVHYGISGSGELELKRKVIYPMLRTIPNDTHASLIADFNDYKLLQIRANGTLIKEYPETFVLNGGVLTITSKTNSVLQAQRIIFPSTDKQALMEVIKLTNKGTTPYKINLSNNIPIINTDPAKGVDGQYIISADVQDTTSRDIAPGDTYSFGVAYAGRKPSDPVYTFSPAYELSKRNKFVDELLENLVLQTPNDTINRAFAFAKLRTTESIFDTRAGLMHGPGGGAYYAAIWANDQAEYANPFFPFLGNLNGNESALNSFRIFARYINPAFKPIPSSIVAEGSSVWNGAGDRGDMAMIAYGASRFTLALGDKDTAVELWPLITWCLEYMERQKTPDGVFKSDTDELEGRIAAGKVNLSTNSLTYGAYISAACLADELQLTTIAAAYRAKVAALRTAIEKYFGAEVQGFSTYRYYDQNTKLRSWICLPLVMGITERKDQTIKALFSPYLWTANGILSESGSKIFWDRSTLYAFRALFSNGATDSGMAYFDYYSSMRLLGEHVPYPVEAWPEGDQRHLAAESALYCRVITEGLFGINPTGFNKFTMAPWLPKGWNVMKLKNIKAFDRTFDIVVTRKGANEIIRVTTTEGKVIQKVWTGKSPIEFILK